MNFTLPTRRSHPAPRSALLAAVVLALGAHPALAHPGHDLADHGVAHIVTSPYHLGILLALYATRPNEKEGAGNLPGQAGRLRPLLKDVVGRGAWAEARRRC